ncbi:hypothetical protein [Chiayiivirga flava]|uniref:DUF4359 domain-containing protein n=1 Tax=Chiayiivirga flava TaxID=659595 RepID=A0A7W8D7V6_9GAMM|nr:hypothetical protein [Chiayiivirga flava]MBB5209518.1 hypothetical protein [Chiayiivirga flava]
MKFIFAKLFMAVLLAISLVACAGLRSREPEDGRLLLDEAISSLQGVGACKASEFSTESEDIKSAIIRREFVVVEFIFSERDGELVYEFIMRRSVGADLLVAEIVVENGNCYEYTFGKIVD